MLIRQNICDKNKDKSFVLREHFKIIVKKENMNAGNQRVCEGRKSGAGI